MMPDKLFRTFIAGLSAVVLTLSACAPAVGQNEAQQSETKKEEKKEEKKETVPQGTPVLWREPADISSRNLLLGPGGEEMKPDLSRVTFVKEETGGYSKKYRVKD